MKTSFVDKPAHFPAIQVNGQPEKKLTQVLLDRRATQHFKSDPVPDEYLEAILRFAGQAPSGYNLQPWHFIVVKDHANLTRLKAAAFNQEKVAEAPVVIIAFGIRGEWRVTMDAILHEGARRGTLPAEKIDSIKKRVEDFMSTVPAHVWLSRHVMIGFTTMMYVAEAYGLDTAPMEGFEPEAVKREFNLPPEAEVIALLAIGFAKEPDKAYGGRLAVENIVFSERYGTPWKSNMS
ncbi:MAG TPA: nitroreductase family protein [Verrucomicrobiae bacterium]|nr:nitroreductase family protein [Verrucomicrobiae bacterium]